jgi:hypothetical protein
LALLAIVAALAAATPNTSDEVFRAFRTFCAQTNGDVGASVSAASKAGWTALPEEARRKLAAGTDEPKTCQARIKQTPEGSMILGVDRSTRTIRGGKLVSNHCQVTSTLGEYSALVKLAGAWARVPPEQWPDPAKGTTFVFANENGRHKALSQAEIDAATAPIVRSRRITQLSIYNLSRRPSLRLDVPAQ